MAATTNGGTFDVFRIGLSFNADGSMVLRLEYTNATNGNVIAHRWLNVPADATKPITDQFGTIISATVPSALATAMTSFLSQVDTTISNGAAAGKLNL